MSATKRTPRHPRDPYATIVERVCDRDRAFFAANPDEAAYLRPYVPGEYSPESLAAIGARPPRQDSWVLVHNLGPGVRCRQPIGCIVAAGPVDGRMTILTRDGVLAEDVPVVGWENAA